MKVETIVVCKPMLSLAFEVLQLYTSVVEPSLCAPTTATIRYIYVVEHLSEYVIQSLCCGGQLFFTRINIQNYLPKRNLINEILKRG